MLSYSPAQLLQLRARARLELQRRGEQGDRFARYRYDVASYLRDHFGWSPWAGSPEHPGQVEVIAAYQDTLRAQHADPDALPRNVIRIEAGHAVGKTKLAAGLVNHFFDCFPPSIIYTFAPTFEQIRDLLWKEIKADRIGTGLPGRVLELALDNGPDHFARGRATSNAHGAGTERAQGQHGPYLMFVLDEAEGVADFVFNAIDSMTSGGIAVVLMLANPRTRTSRFHRIAARSDVVSFRISCIYHPNVLAGRELVPGAVKRAYVEKMVEDHCAVVDQHDADAHTFALPWRPGVIYKPDAEFLFRVLGVAPANIADNVLVTVGRFEYAATAVAPRAIGKPAEARIGVDVARFGKDVGTVYTRHAGELRRAAQLAQVDTKAYVRAIKAEAHRLAARGVTSLHVRVDAGGGYGAGIVDDLRADEELIRLFADFVVLEVHFGGSPRDAEAYADLATEMYGHLAESLLAIRLVDPPPALEQDLVERTYTWRKVAGVDVKKLESKDEFRKRLGRSPDDGDGAALAAAPDHLFTRPGKPATSAPRRPAPMPRAATTRGGIR